MVNFNPMDYGYIVRWQSDLENTKESILPVCDYLYNMNNGFQQMWAEIKKFVKPCIFVSRLYFPHCKKQVNKILIVAIVYCVND